MRRILLTAVLSFASMGAALAAPGNMDRMSRMQADLGRACQADCLQQAARPGAHPAAAQACQIRCGAGQAFARQEGRSPAVASGRGVQLVAQRPVAVAAAPAAQQSHGVIYAARSPSAGFGLVVGERDRLVAFRAAEQRCAQGGPGCRVIAEFTAACGAVAQGVRRNQWAIVMTSDASTYNVMSTNAGSGATREAAESEAMAECRARDPHSTCRIVAAQCGSRG
ncbi:DUF4189 domain-containing protein [Sediminicoccus sp. KRV36]|uniref:DUF4189 domain-containing protein n=1 Tax=Sediminicoccus sp. KRV36 TaxID=3133721 RepID=UPI00200DDDCF|nr:DUF4189 domain-containing protein [Sediminicoccus rosea]UPY38365.1 DUF4189 domain-containing protein [Sediminicoccus rosea]